MGKGTLSDNAATPNLPISFSQGGSSQLNVMVATFCQNLRLNVGYKPSDLDPYQAMKISNANGSVGHSCTTRASPTCQR
ncbi:unnamed protein product [Camellia sinensis]